ncbi:hypothetical protein FRC10_004979, partial [Ceratobasidium sp. 414]
TLFVAHPDGQELMHGTKACRPRANLISIRSAGVPEAGPDTPFGLYLVLGRTRSWEREVAPLWCYYST